MIRLRRRSALPCLSAADLSLDAGRRVWAKGYHETTVTVGQEVYVDRGGRRVFVVVETFATNTGWVAQDQKSLVKS